MSETHQASLRQVATGWWPHRPLQGQLVLVVLVLIGVGTVVARHGTDPRAMWTGAPPPHGAAGQPVRLTARAATAVSPTPEPLRYYLVDAAPAADRLHTRLADETGTASEPPHVRVIAGAEDERRVWTEIMVVNSRQHYAGRPGVAVIDLRPTPPPVPPSAP